MPYFTNTVSNIEAYETRKLFLWLLEEYPTKIVGPESFKSILGLAKLEEEERLLGDDKEILTLILNKVLACGKDIKEEFFKEMLTMMHTLNNLRFLDMPRTIDFLFQCLDEAKGINIVPICVSIMLLLPLPNRSSGLFVIRGLYILKAICFILLISFYYPFCLV